MAAPFLLACQPRIFYLQPVYGSRGSNKLKWSLLKIIKLLFPFK